MLVAGTVVGVGLAGRVGVGVNGTIIGPAVPSVERVGVVAGCRTGLTDRKVARTSLDSVI